ncbi:MAG: glycine cleavage system aminomethyltransferase GcvT, partial [Gammaproteobacteria bacterium]
MTNRTPLYDTHLECGAKMVDFAGWDMPIHYGSQIDEHHKVRTDAGMFDVSHMVITDLQGGDAKDYLRYLLANDVEKLKIKGKALYSCMLKENGGVIDDLIVYYMNDDWYRMVINAATTDKDIAWMERQAADTDVQIQPRRDLGMIAIQGPNAREKTLPLLPEELREAAGQLEPFHAATNGEWFVGRTGYTGEDGFEVLLPENQVIALWNALAGAGVRSCGLGARDTLRLEAGMNLYGADMDEDTSPLESGLAWTVPLGNLERDFIGRSALVVQKVSGGLPLFTGVLLEGKGVLRNHQKLYDGER